MCIFFTCRSCKLGFFNFCADGPRNNNANATDNTSDDSDNNDNDNKDNANKNKNENKHNNETRTCPPELCTRHPNRRQKCLSCEAVLGALERLQHLVYRYPQLQTEGLSWLDSMADWEKDAAGLEGLTRKKRKKWDKGTKDDESHEEERKVQARVKDMGLQGLKDERKEHQGFGSTSPTLAGSGTGTDQHKLSKEGEEVKEF